nr:MAG TPA: hypothetical protein [Caudoviricetes sp.]
MAVQHTFWPSFNVRFAGSHSAQTALYAAAPDTLGRIIFYIGSPAMRYNSNSLLTLLVITVSFRVSYCFFIN